MSLRARAHIHTLDAASVTYNTFEFERIRIRIILGAETSISVTTRRADTKLYGFFYGVRDRRRPTRAFFRRSSTSPFIIDRGRRTA